MKTLYFISQIFFQCAVSGHILPSLQLAHLLHIAGNGIRAISCAVQHFVHLVQLVDDGGNFLSSSLQHLWTWLLLTVLFDNWSHMSWLQQRVSIGQSSAPEPSSSVISHTGMGLDVSNNCSCLCCLIGCFSAWIVDTRKIVSSITKLREIIFEQLN